MTTIDKFSWTDDSEHIQGMLLARGMNLDLIHDLPSRGYIVKDNDVVVAAGFLRMCEGNYAMIDSLISNPTQPSELRHIALDLITNRLISMAKDMNIRHLTASTIDNDTILRSKRHGFAVLSHTLIGLDLASK